MERIRGYGTGSWVWNGFVGMERVRGYGTGSQHRNVLAGGHPEVDAGQDRPHATVEHHLLVERSRTTFQLRGA
jgi:hypothetical protein